MPETRPFPSGRCPIPTSVTRASVARRAFLLALAFGAACSAPTEPLNYGKPTLPEIPAVGWPALERPGLAYYADTLLYARATDDEFTRLFTRYVLYDDGEFQFQVFTRRTGVHSYRGRYALDGAAIALTFSADAARWSATGQLTGSDLFVRYNLLMHMSDFIDGRYTSEANDE